MPDAGSVTIRRSRLVAKGRCRVERAGRTIAFGKMEIAVAVMQRGDVLILSPHDFRRYRQGMAETVEASA